MLFIMRYIDLCLTFDIFSSKHSTSKNNVAENDISRHLFKAMFHDFYFGKLKSVLI